MGIEHCSRSTRSAMRGGSLPVVLVSMVTTLLASTGPAGARPELEARNGRQECVGSVPDCHTVRGELLRIRRDSEREIDLECSVDAPFFWNWSAELSAHVQIQLLQILRDDSESQIGARFALSEHSDTRPGYARLFLGCSNEEPSRGELWVRYELLGYHPHE